VWRGRRWPWRHRGGPRGRAGLGARVPADGHGVPDVPGVRGQAGVRRRQGRAAHGTAVLGWPGAPAQRGRRERAADGPRHDDPRAGDVPAGPGRRAGRGRRRAGRLRVRLRAAAQRRPRAARPRRRHGRLHERPAAGRRKGDHIIRRPFSASAAVPRTGFSRYFHFQPSGCGFTRLVFQFSSTRLVSKNVHIVHVCCKPPKILGFIKRVTTELKFSP